MIISGTFRLNGLLRLPSTGATFVPYGMPLVNRPGSFLLGPRVNGRQSPFQCFAGRQTEDIETTFAPGLPMPTRIDSGTIDNPAFIYRVSYKIEGRTLKLRREFISRVSSQSCPAELEARIAKEMNVVAGNVRNVFDFTAPVASQEPPKTQQSIDVARVVPADQKRRIDIFYWIDPDCSSPELPSVRIIEHPANGRLSVERGTGFTAFPQNNPRFECNKRKSDGVSVVYQPAAQFTGRDTITVEIILPSGQSFKRRYVIDVKAVQNVSSAPNPNQTN